MLFFFHRYELPAVLQAEDPTFEQDDSPQLGNEAIMPGAEVFLDDTVSGIPTDGNTLEHEENSSVPNEPTENETSSPDVSTVSSENNNVKTDSKQRDSSPVQESNSNLVS